MAVGPVAKGGPICDFGRRRREKLLDHARILNLIFYSNTRTSDIAENLETILALRIRSIVLYHSGFRSTEWSVVSNDVASYLLCSEVGVKFRFDSSIQFN